MHLKTLLRYSLLLTAVSPFSPVHAQKQPLQLWYKQPAAVWTDALPLGNGRLGAMVFGGVAEEHVQLNEETLWSGRPRSYSHPGAVKYLQPMRQLLAEGKQAEAEAMGEKYFMGLKDPDDSAYQVQKDAWFKSVRNETAPAAIDYNDNNWKTMQLPTPEGWERVGLEGTDGSLWFRTSFNVPAKWLGKNLVLDLGRIRDMDFTYVNGQLVGHDEGISQKRKYTIPASALKEGKNTLAIQVINFFDKGGFTGVKGSARTLVVYPVGGDVDTVSLGNTWKYFIQNDTPPVLPRYEADYLPFGDLYIRFAHGNNASDYKRSLSLDSAISNISYTVNGVTYHREYFISAPHQCVVLHLTASKPGALSLQAVLNTPHKKYVVKKIDDHTLSLSLQVSNGVLKAAGYLYATTTGGKLTVSDTAINLGQATEANFYLVAATSFKNYKDVSGDPVAACKAALARVKGVPYSTIKAAHLKEYRPFFDTFSFTVPAGKNNALPTNERIRKFNMQDDAALVPLFLMYSRYLLISSSRPGTQPANLQGIWNDLLTPPWGSKYTTNINLEMNYWPSETLDLSSCSEPLFRLIENLSRAGAATAEIYYHAPGWVLHHNTDLWCGTAAINSSTHGIWPTGGAWLCHQVWEHYLFTQDTAFLRQYYPVMRAAAEFFVKFLIPDPKHGWLISTPSASPEHGGLVAGPTMDHQIIRDLFHNSIAAAAILHVDAGEARVWQEKCDRIAPNQIGRFGQLQEWLEDKDDTSDTHRHISHLWGVYPGTDITWKDSALMKAARQSLIYRGDDGTGWSLAWKINCWARFHDGDHALMLLDKLLSNAVGYTGEHGGVYPNMFDAHPPFQIDGNFGGAAGLAEMLVQSQDSVIELLPALPAALPNGEIYGIRARGGFTLGLQWAGGTLRSITLKSKTGAPCRLRYKDHTLVLKTTGPEIHLDGELKPIR